MGIRAWLNRVFKMEEINGGERCPTYLYRWTLLKGGKAFSVYLHHFVGDDWSRDLHDHPKRFISIGLWGRYREESAPLGHTFRQSIVQPWGDTCGECLRPHRAHLAYRIYRAPWIRSFPATHIHRLSLIGRQPCWTLVVVLRASRPWGFWHNGWFIPWRKYIDSDAATQAKACSE